MNRITDLLDLEDANVIISDIQPQGQAKIITFETPPTAHFCPSCGFRIHSLIVEQNDGIKGLTYLPDPQTDLSQQTLKQIGKPSKL